MEPFTFARSKDLELLFAVKINRLEGYEKPLPYSTLLRRPDLRHRGSNLSTHSELYITVQPFADSKPLTVNSQTSYKHFKTLRLWNQWLTLPINFSALPAKAQLAITLWDLSPVSKEGGPSHHHIPFGGTTIPLFDQDGILMTGRQKCRVWRHKQGDGNSDTTTPWQEVKRRGPSGINGEPLVVDGRHKRQDAELERLVDLVKKHEMGDIVENRWLDQMVFRQIEKLERQSVRGSLPPYTPGLDGSDQVQCVEGDADHVDGSFFLYLELPRFDLPIVFTDHEYDPPPISSIQAPQSQAAAVDFRPPPDVQTAHLPITAADDTPTMLIYDPEVGRADNPAENKHRRLARNKLRSATDRDAKPNPKMRDQLNDIMSYGPSVELSEAEKEEIWKFRYHLTREKRALTKLVKSIDWDDAGESKQVISLLPKWADIDIDDALELLGPSVKNAAVRAYAVERLSNADDEELLLYLLQLVQALKFEPTRQGDDAETDTSLAAFLIGRSVANLKLGNYLYWYLMVELDDEAPTKSPEDHKLFAKVSYQFMMALDRTPEGQKRRVMLRRQGEFVTVLSKVSKDVRNSRADRLKKIEQLKKVLADPKSEMLLFEPPLPLPLDPEILLTGVVPEQCSVFKSSLFPLSLTFNTASGEPYQLIFKTGDDLRQDQLVIQIIALMDRLLQKENLDLRLTPYRILATSTLTGAIQLIQGIPVSVILGDNRFKGSILGFLRHHNPPTKDSPSVLGVRKEAMDNYVRSVAGYCVITYLLGVGDRHLDNLLLAPDGRFLHIDFGYILGRDPKPMAPLMKLSREMVEGMGGSAGGADSQFDTFRQYCFTAYTTLRRSSSLILNLFALMQDANIPGLMVFGDQAVRKVEERFKLDVSEDEAIAFFAQLIEREMGAWGAVVIDKLHGIVQGWRT